MHTKNKRMKYSILSLLTLFFCASLSTTNIAIAAEQLNFKIPEGYKIANRRKGKTLSILEMIKTDENLKNWTRMVTIQTFQNPERFAPEKFINTMAMLSKRKCGNIHLIPVKNGQQNGFEFSQKILLCQFKDKTKKSVTTNIKAIKGDQLFHVAQVANRVVLSDTESKFWAIYLRDTIINRE